MYTCKTIDHLLKQQKKQHLAVPSNLPKTCSLRQMRCLGSTAEVTVDFDDHPGSVGSFNPFSARFSYGCSYCFPMIFP